MALALILAFAVASPAPTGAAPADAIAVQTVSFTVQNINRSAVACAVDGQTYRVQGEIVGPSSALQPGAAPGAITLYLHPLTAGQAIWSFDAVPNYDFARGMATLGHVSLIIDRLGYGASDHPNGFGSCFGGQADMAHQIVQDLRAGTYTVVGGAPLTFARVALAGVSAGGAITQVEAYSFRDVDAIGVFSYADQDFSAAGSTAVGESFQVCQNGGVPSGGPGSPGGYAYFGQTDQEFQSSLFYHADTGVVAAATAARVPDPCGDVESLGAVIGADQTNLATVAVPVLLVYGANDAILLPQAGPDQRQHFSGSGDVTQITLANTGHALPLQITRVDFRSQVANWLRQRGF
jgi:pimeloyl-ACP methyl ester carboxylesterase